MSDRSRRTRYATEDKREDFDEPESRSLSAPDFAQWCCIQYPCISAWLAKRRNERQLSFHPADCPAFVPAELSDEAASDRAL